MNHFVTILTARMDFLEPILCGMLVYFLVRSKAARQFGYLGRATMRATHMLSDMSASDLVEPTCC